MTFVFGDLTQLLILSYILDFVSDLLIFIAMVTLQGLPKQILSLSFTT